MIPASAVTPRGIDARTGTAYNRLQQLNALSREVEGIGPVKPGSLRCVPQRIDA